MDERFTWLRQEIERLRALLIVAPESDAPPMVAFWNGLGAGIALANVEAQEQILELHQPSPGSNFCVTCSGDNAPVAWPCPTIKAVAHAYRHAAGFDEEVWES